METKILKEFLIKQYFVACIAFSSPIKSEIFQKVT